MKSYKPKRLELSEKVCNIYIFMHTFADSLFVGLTQPSHPRKELHLWLISNHCHNIIMYIM